MSILHVVFKVAGTEYAMPAAEVLQMESYSGATAIPGAAAHVAGIVQVRGKVVPVIDLRARFGMAGGERTLDSRLIIGNDGGRSVALLVDSAREVVKLEEEQVEPPPPMVADEAHGFVRAVARLGDRLLMLIDFKRVIGEDQLHA
ncbi:MAG: chemotaxis protein CheW [Myxococcales bacterium]|nr:chemotaxis protein CheW [Myxococcales bacterium]